MNSKNEIQHISDGTTIVLIYSRDGSKTPCYLDTADFNSIKNYIWCVQRVTGNPNLQYARTNPSFRMPILMHQIIMGRKNIDHKDGNGLNNRRENLRLADHQHNQFNKRKFRLKKGASSLYKGVYWDAAHQKYRAQVVAYGQKIVLGDFLNEVDAAKAYDTAALKYHGEFARLNFS